MLRLVGSIVTAIRLYLMRRRQYDNLRLRAYFRERYAVDIGMYSYGCFDRWRMPGPLVVGRYCSFANTVRVAPTNHPVQRLTTHPMLYDRTFGIIDEDMHPPAPLIVEDDVWVGHNVMILPGCKHIGRGAVIGAGAIVTRDVAPYAIMAGNPARRLRDRFAPGVIAALEKSRWWELDARQLRDLVKGWPEVAFGPTEQAVEGWLRDVPR